MRQIREFRSNFENIPRDCRATVARQSQDIRKCVSRLSRECGLFSFSLLRQSRNSLAKYFDENICINVLNLFKNFATSSRLATSSRHMKIFKILVRHSHECRAKARDKIGKQSLEIRMPLRFYEFLFHFADFTYRQCIFHGPCRKYMGIF